MQGESRRLINRTTMRRRGEEEINNINKLIRNPNNSQMVLPFEGLVAIGADVFALVAVR